MIQLKTVRRRLRTLQDRHGQEALAAKIRISRPFLCQVITGKWKPSAKILKFLKLERVEGYVRIA